MNLKQEGSKLSFVVSVCSSCIRWSWSIRSFLRRYQFRLLQARTPAPLTTYNSWRGYIISLANGWESGMFRWCVGDTVTRSEAWEKGAGSLRHQDLSPEAPRNSVKTLLRRRLLSTRTQLFTSRFSLHYRGLRSAIRPSTIDQNDGPSTSSRQGVSTQPSPQVYEIPVPFSTCTEVIGRPWPLADNIWSG